MQESGMKSVYCGLFQRRQCLIPTLRGWLLLVVVAAALAVCSVKSVHPFLAVNDPLPGGALVVEGWMPDYGFEQAIAEFRRHHYSKMYVTGGPMEVGSPLSEYRTFAELGAAILSKLGMEKEAVQAVPSAESRRDRTYASAVALRDLLQRHGELPQQINLISMGAHSRRSRLLFRKAFGGKSKIGILAITDKNYDSAQWWRSSQGVRTVIDEMVAYLYARLLFNPEMEN